MSLDISFTLHTPSAGEWEFDYELSSLNIGAAIAGAHGLFARNSLNNASFIILEAAGFASPAVNPMETTVNGSVESIIDIPFNFDGETLATVWVVLDSGSFDVTNQLFQRPDVLKFEPPKGYVGTYTFYILLSNMGDDGTPFYTLTFEVE